jgi:hypothetical protein
MTANIFFGRGMRGQKTDIFWVSAKIIGKLKPDKRRKA